MRSRMVAVTTAERAAPILLVENEIDSATARRAALEAGAVAYLTKPFSIAALTAMIRDILKPVDGTAP